MKIVIATMALHNHIRKFALHDHHFEETENDSNFVPDEETNMEVVIQEKDHGSKAPEDQEMERFRNTITITLMSG